MIRSECHLELGTKFIVITDGENILLKPIEKPKLSSFKALLSKSQNFAKEQGLQQSDVTNIIKKVRHERRS